MPSVHSHCPVISHMPASSPAALVHEAAVLIAAVHPRPAGHRPRRSRPPSSPPATIPVTSPNHRRPSLLLYPVQQPHPAVEALVKTIVAPVATTKARRHARRCSSPVCSLQQKIEHRGRCPVLQPMTKKATTSDRKSFNRLRKKLQPVYDWRYG